MMNVSRNQARYSRQTVIPTFGEIGQARISSAIVVIIGCGGLGHPIAAYLASAGLGKIILVDDDCVSLDNLGRQFLFREDDAGRNKAEVIANWIRGLNSEIFVEVVQMRVSPENIAEIIANSDLVVDATDNFEARYTISDGTLVAEVPHVWGSVYRYEGSLGVFPPDPERNYRAHFPESPPIELSPSCASGGVMGSVCGVIGSMMSTQVISFLANGQTSLWGKVASWDGETMRLESWDVIPDKESALDMIISQRSQEISAESLLEMLSSSKVLLVDVREDYERAEGSIEGSEHAPLTDLWNWARSKQFTNQQVVFYCASGYRSLQAVEIVLKANPQIENPYSLSGGYAAFCAIKSRSA